jgi:anti-sigma B factor antagonist
LTYTRYCRKVEAVINLYINERRDGDVTILDLKGRVRVGGTTVALHNAIRTLVREEKTLILLNLSGVTHIDSCGLGELMASHVTLQKTGGEIKLVQLTETLRELMTATRLVDVFEVFENEAEAIGSFAGHVLAVKKPQLFFV